MKVLLTTQRIECEGQQIDFSHGIGYLTSVLRQAGHEVKVLECDATVTDTNSIKKVLKEEDCDLIGLGGISSTFPAVEWMMKYIRSVRSTPIVLGGGLLTSNSRAVFDHLRPDYGVLGEGEATIVELLDRLNGSTSSCIPGLMVDNSLPEPRKPIMDLDSIPWPAWDDFDIEGIIERSKYLVNGRRRLSVLASRSCPFACSFCFHTLGNIYRRRSPSSVVAEMSYLIHRYKAEYFRFSDELFAYDSDWISKLCQLMIDEKLGINWECAGKPGYVPEKSLALMKEAGCEHVGCGFESGSDTILKSMKKKTTVRGARKAIKAYRKAGIDISGAFMVGDPLETPETIQETVDFIIEMELPIAWMGFMTPYPGTEIYQYCLEKGLITDEIEWLRTIGNSTTLRINMTCLSDSELITLQSEAIDQIRDVLNLNAYNIPDKVKAGFLEKTSMLSGKVFVTPVGEHTRTVLPYAYCKIQGFFDGDKTRVRRSFEGKPVYLRTKENIEKLKPDWILVTAAVNLKDIIINDLIKYGFDRERIISLL